MPNYAPRISSPYSDLSGVFQKFADTCEAMVVYEHEADEQVSRTHCHFVMVNCKYKTPEPLKRIFRQLVKDERDGNDLWAWTHEKNKTPNLSFIGYMAKNDLEPVFTKEVSAAAILLAQEEWKRNKPHQSLIKPLDPVKKLTKFQIITEVSQRVIGRELSRSGKPYSGHKDEKIAIFNVVSPQVVFEYISQVLAEHEQPVGLYKVMDLYDGFMMMHCQQKFVSNCMAVLGKREMR